MITVHHWDATAKTATFNLTPGQPANDNFHATLAASSVSNFSGNTNASSATLDYYFLAADGDRNRVVDIHDFNLLATNFGKSGQTFTQGNYDYSTDGVVSITDFNILATNFGKSVPPSPAPQSAPRSFVIGSRQAIDRLDWSQPQNLATELV